MECRKILLIWMMLFAPAVFAGDTPPEWSKGAVWYEIVPERFRNIYTRNDPVKENVVGEDVDDWQIHPWASDWYKMQIWEMNRGLTLQELIPQRRYGGDLFGVSEKLRYLQDLGVDVICLTPIFEAPSILKYDFSTLHHVDNNFGQDRKGDLEKIVSEKEDPANWTLTKADEAFLDLITRAHDAHMKIVIEVQFNYCGEDFWAFKDLKEKQQNSVYKDWFEVFNWDDPATLDTVEFSYQCWQDDKSMPLFKKSHGMLVEPVKKYILDITKRWMDPNSDGVYTDGIDGWFVSFVNELASDFWWEWLKYVKSLNPEVITVAESLQEAPHLLGENKFDVVTNYVLAEVIKTFFINSNDEMNLTEFSNALQKLRQTYPQKINQSLLNLLDSHKTDRLSSVIKNNLTASNGDLSANPSRKLDPTKPTEENVRLQKLIALFQMTYVGAPMLYYGDETGMWGTASQDNLKPMLWKEFVYEKESYYAFRPDYAGEVNNVFNQDLYSHYRLLNKIRHENPALQTGEYKEYLLDEGKALFAFHRKFDLNEVIVVLNLLPNKQTLELDVPWKHDTKVKDQLNDLKYKVKNGKLKMGLKKKWGAILVKDK